MANETMRSTSSGTTGTGDSLISMFAIILLTGLVILFFLYALPRLRETTSEGGTGGGTTIDLNLPSSDTAQ